jgi:enamine deaminase RidA (YjgF/YER057c/UK114 family)
MSALMLMALLAIEVIAGHAPAQEKNVTAQSGKPPEIQVVQTKEVTVITLAGVGPQDQDGHLVGPGDFAAQFKQTWDNAQRLLLSAGALLRNIATVTVYMSDAKWQATFTALLRERFSDWNPVTSFAVAPQLRTPGALLEIQAVAVIKKRKPIRR